MDWQHQLLVDSDDQERLDVVIDALAGARRRPRRIVRANSYSFGTITQEAVILEVNPDDPEPVNMPTATVVTSAETPGPSRDTTGASGCIPLSVHGKSSTTRKRRRIRRSLYDEDIYAGPEEVINTTQKEINMRQNLITHRQTLLDIQKRQAEVRLEEAEYQRQLALEKLEEAEENREMNDKI
ncbi:hypothetical protein Pcinc_018608 [Petrolisthes cinctipes]|uniref:Uncharacterized protein n=1 Tax=Petrolisthes cinctipes TaxID=88211 RepID=A0AAE1FND0_PETCI|nr:hypothetical protein Pcinc_018608 [Petrolisthes cinctipes]